jgi:hypothetical protein
MSTSASLSRAWRPSLHVLAIAAIVASALVVAPRRAEAEDSPYMSTIGALAAAQLYTTANYLDVTKEALVRGAFSAKNVRSDLERMGTMTDNVGKYLAQVLQGKVTAEDQAFFQEAIAIYGLLKTESLALHKYAGTRAQPDLDTFTKARDTAWDHLKKLLKLP